MSSNMSFALPLTQQLNAGWTVLRPLVLGIVGAMGLLLLMHLEWSPSFSPRQLHIAQNLPPSALPVTMIQRALLEQRISSLSSQTSLQSARAAPFLAAGASSPSSGTGQLTSPWSASLQNAFWLLGGATTILLTLSGLCVVRTSSEQLAIQPHSAPNWQMCSTTGSPTSTANDLEDQLLLVLGSYDGKDSGVEKRILNLVDQLCRSTSASADVVTDPRLNGRWRLRFTSKSKFDPRNPLGARVDGSRPGLEALFGGDESTAPSSSPIQRAVTTLSYQEDGRVRIYQNIDLNTSDPRVDQLVFIGSGPDPLLRLSAAATPRPPRRLDFTFDLAYFLVFGIRIPYPVPFRLLGREAMGFLDTEYLSDRVRITRGNKGTTFVLAREL